MSLNEKEHTFASPQITAAPLPSRRLLLFIAAACVLLMGFYTLTDGAHVAHDPLLAGADWTSYALCHRITERSFVIGDRQFPLCARCTGMYLGVALGVAALILGNRWQRAMLPNKKLLLILFGFIALMGIDGLNSYSHFFPNAPHLYEPRNWLRLLTGMGTGLTMAIIILPAMAQTFWARPVYAPILENGRDLLALLLLGAVGILLVLSNQPALSYVLALLSVGGLLFVVMTLNSVVLLILLRRDGRLMTWRQAVLPLAAGLTLALIEISAVSMVRWNLTGTLTGFPGL